MYLHCVVFVCVCLIGVFVVVSLFTITVFVAVLRFRCFICLVCLRSVGVMCLSDSVVLIVCSCLFKLCLLMHGRVIAFCCGRCGFPLFYLSCLCVICVVVSCVGFIAWFLFVRLFSMF